MVKLRRFGNRDFRLRLDRDIRDLVTFLSGLAGIGYETFFKRASDPQLLVLFTAMVGLPAFLRSDEHNAPQPPLPPQQPPYPPYPLYPPYPSNQSIPPPYAPYQYPYPYMAELPSEEEPKKKQPVKKATKKTSKTAKKTPPRKEL